MIDHRTVSGMRGVLNNYLMDNDDDDLVFLMDSMDVWLQLSETTLIRRFKEYDQDVIVGAERKWWPNQWDSVSPTSPLRMPTGKLKS